MVVLAASILDRTKGGNVLFSRQFVQLTRSRIDSLLQAFPKLITESSEHTFVETEQVRYVYQVLGDLWILLITNKLSNISEDLDTLRTFSRLVCTLISL